MMLKIVKFHRTQKECVMKHVLINGLEMENVIKNVILLNVNLMVEIVCSRMMIIVLMDVLMT